MSNFVVDFREKNKLASKLDSFLAELSNSDTEDENSFRKLEEKAMSQNLVNLKGKFFSSLSKL